LTATLEIEFCLRCGHTAYPHREVCRRCHSMSFAARPAGPGTVEEVTVVEHAVGDGATRKVLVTVRLDHGPVVIAGADRVLDRGERVNLEKSGEGVRTMHMTDA
jgi:uncharacterized OB-fold protein